MPEIIMKKQEVTFIKKIKRETGEFMMKRIKQCLVWNPNLLHEILKMEIDRYSEEEDDKELETIN